VDFAQHGDIATLHRFTDRKLADLEAELDEWTRLRRVTLVIPCLASEMNGPALRRIVEEVGRAHYVDRVVIGLDRADADDHARAKEFFSVLPQEHHILWQDGPNLRAVEAQLRDERINPAQPGKGRNVWWCLGYALGRSEPGAIVLQDADVVEYSREMLARLVYPVVHPTFGYVFSKAFYVRADAERMHGRVTRLLVAPLLRSLQTMVGDAPFLDFLESFRYPLAGEVCIRSEALLAIRVPADWGLEIGMLGEIYRNHRAGQVCQVEMAGTYDHKHQPVSGDDPSSGLHKMAIDLTKAVVKRLALEGRVLSTDHFRTLRATYQRAALELVDRYHDDAVMNGLRYDRHAETEVVDVFARAVSQAGDQFLVDPLDTPFMPSWARVRSAVPDIHDRIAEAVEADG
jgi:glucosyl-3-phosphoglycerate synthase